MSVDNNKSSQRKKESFSGSWSLGVFIITSILLAGSGFFALTSSAMTPMTAAFAQEEQNNTTTVTSTRPSNATGTTKSAASSEIELSQQPIYQEHVRDVSETPINQTHAQLVVEGNGTLTLPNGTETIKTTSTGGGIVSIFSTFAGKEVITTEDGRENATAISYEIARSNKEQGIGKGISIAVIHTNSIGRLAPLDGMILVGQEEFQPDGRALLTYWEWQSGIPLVRMQQPPMTQESLMNTTEIPSELPPPTNVS
jgi:hypothetical protein